MATPPSSRICIPKAVLDFLVAQQGEHLPQLTEEDDKWCFEANAKIFVTRGGVLAGNLTLIDKARNFAASATKHVAAGMPQASEEEVARRFAICQACEHFEGKACRKCGCPVVREKKFLSKLSWAKERCPVGKWGPVSS